MATIQPNRRGRATLLRSKNLRDLVERVADRVASNARAEGVLVEGIPGDRQLPIEVDTYQTDRARASVTIKHPAGLAAQAKHGLLTKAASQLGLEIVKAGGRDLVLYTTRAGTTRTATRRQAEAWGGSYAEMAR